MFRHSVYVEIQIREVYRNRKQPRDCVVVLGGLIPRVSWQAVSASCVSVVGVLAAKLADLRVVYETYKG